MTTAREYLLGVLLGVFLVHALWYAARQLWEAARTPARIRKAEQALAEHVAKEYGGAQ